MAGGNATRFDAAGPEGDILAKHRVGVDGIFHIPINGKLPAMRDLRAMALHHHDIVAIPAKMREGLFGKRRRISRLFHKINDPFGPFPGGQAENGDTRLRYMACRKIWRLTDWA